MSAIGVSFLTRGRAAWIASMVLGAVLGLIGGLTGPQVFVIVAGGVFFVFGLVMLIISFATGGVSD